MKDIISINNRIEYSATVENARLYVLIDKVRNDSDKTAVTALHKHAYAELFVCKSGSITINTADRLIRLGAGEILLVPGNYSHAREREAAEGAVWCSVGVHITKNRRRNARDIYSRFAELLGAESPMMLGTSGELCDMVMDFNGQPYGADDCLPALQTAAILSRFSHSFVAGEGKGEEEQNQSRDIKRTAYLEFFIENYYREDFTAEEIAEQMFISVSQLSRIVKARFGMTLHQIILKKRLDEAARLLREGADSVENIVDKVGFRTVSCFYRAFRAEFGVTPYAYRKL